MTRDRLREIKAGTHAVIDLDAYSRNIQQLRRMAGATRQLMAIVKANAYGHGAVECARAALDSGASYLGVARIDEALELRRAGVDAPVLVIGPPNLAQIGVALVEDVALTVATEQALDAVLAAAAATGERATVHLKVDTGLHRYGALPELAIALARRLAGSTVANFEGIYTHFSSADEEDSEPTLDQIAVMRTVMDQLKEADDIPPLVHIANSAAIIEGHYPDSNMVRSGIATYGLDPSGEVPVSGEFQQVLTLRSVITRRFTLPAGGSVSYNRTYTAEEDEPAASVPVGYADGIERHLSNRGWFVHRGRRCPIIGLVCMDQTVIRVPADAREQDPITLIGPGDEGEMTIQEVGELSQTNTYEPVVRLAARVPRIFIRGGRPASWSIPMLGERGEVTPIS